MTQLNFLNSTVRRTLAVYEAVFGYSVPADIADLDADWLAWRLHKAIRDWQPVEELGSKVLDRGNHGRTSKPSLPLESRALTRWEYLTDHKKQAGKIAVAIRSQGPKPK